MKQETDNGKTVRVRIKKQIIPELWYYKLRGRCVDVKEYDDVLYQVLSNGQFYGKFLRREDCSKEIGKISSIDIVNLLGKSFCVECDNLNEFKVVWAHIYQHSIDDIVCPKDHWPVWIMIDERKWVSNPAYAYHLDKRVPANDYIDANKCELVPQPSDNKPQSLLWRDLKGKYAVIHITSLQEHEVFRRITGYLPFVKYYGGDLYIRCDRQSGTTIREVYGKEIPIIEFADFEAANTAPAEQEDAIGAEYNRVMKPEEPKLELGDLYKEWAEAEKQRHAQPPVSDRAREIAAQHLGPDHQTVITGTMKYYYEAGEELYEPLDKPITKGELLAQSIESYASERSREEMAGFAEWAQGNDWLFLVDKWVKTSYGRILDEKPTTSDLIDIYQSSKNKKG